MKKDLLVLALAALMIAVLCSGTKIQSVDEYYLTHIDDITEETDTVTLSIRCDTVLENWDDLDPALQSEKYVPADGDVIEWVYTCDLGRDVGCQWMEGQSR